MKDMAGSEFIRELFAQREWLGRLAFSLVNDEALAEDLVQETWLSALHTQPGMEAGLRGWLATVLRNRARSHARDERERKRREQWTAREELLPSAGDVLERAAIQQEVAGVVMQLEEPYRETILLRFFDELPPRAIARRMKVPVSTVKTRLSRGLERLRMLLDRNYGGERSAWMASIGVLCVVPRGGWIWKWSAAAGVLLIAGGGVWRAVAPGEGDAGGAREDLAVLAIPSERVAVPVEEVTRPVSEPAVASAPSEPEPEPVAVEVAPGKLDMGSSKGTPGGMARIPGGETWVGADFEEMARLQGELQTTEEGFSRFLLQRMRSHPRHERSVEDFNLMGTEVTNQQYLEFVLATQARPPIGWALDIPENLPRTTEELLKELGYLSAEGDSLAGTASDFSPAAHQWWNRRTGKYMDRGRDWQAPKGAELLPVTYVDYKDAQAFAAWAGLRLATEFEFERAIRGKKGQGYPWGVHWKEGYAVIGDSANDGPTAVGLNRRGRTKQGVDNLSGNVREWTSSLLEMYPGYEELADANGWRSSAPLRSIDGTHRVVRGGSFASQLIHAHGAVREELAISTWLPDLGFRCAASSQAGVDRAASLVDERSAFLERREKWIDEDAASATAEWRAALAFDRANTTTFAPERTLAIDRWRVKNPLPRAKAKHYAVISAYECALVMPATAVTDGRQRPGDPDADLVRVAKMVTTFDLAVPALPAGESELWLRGVFGGDASIEFRGSSTFRTHFIPGTRAQFSTEQGPHQIRLLPDRGGPLRELEFKLSIPGRDGGWWNLEWTVQADRESLDGKWRRSR